MQVSDFNFDLPENLIAQEPLADRASSRMLHLQRDSGSLADANFSDLPDLLYPNDLLVLNNTRVLPARLFGKRSGTRAQPLSPQNPAARNFLSGQVEVLLTKQLSDEPNEWECLVRPGRKIGVGEQLFFGEEGELQAEVTGRGAFGERRIRFESKTEFFATVDRLGHMPLPPYIRRADRSSDNENYQTVYARERGSVAAPTAGLHFTPEVLERIRQRGVEIAEVTLHVGLGTFQPVRTERVEDHKLHCERYHIPPETAEAVNRAVDEGRRVVAVGTTTVRTLEYAASHGRISAGSGEADIFIYPGYVFRVVRALLTNFHLPQSSLLMLVSAFAGKDRTLAAYEYAIKKKYRFYSYGDCMFID